MRLLGLDEIEEEQKPPMTRTQAANRKTRQSTEADSEVVDNSADREVSNNCSFNPNRVQNLNHRMVTRQSRLGRTVEKLMDRPENVSQPVLDMVETHESDGGNRQYSHASEKIDRVYCRPKRRIKSLVKLGYSDFGQPKDQQLTIVHRGMVIHIKDSPEWKNHQCQTLWCHQMAKCSSCASSSPAAALKAIVQI